MTDIKIYTATNSDKVQLADWFSFYGDMKLIEKRIDCYLGHNSTIIAKDRDKIVGVLQWHVKESAVHGLAEIEEVMITESYRGQGIGSQLVIYTIDTIRASFTELSIRPRKIFLFVARENTVSRNLYEKHGFRMIGTAGNLFNDNVEELFYSLEL